MKLQGAIQANWYFQAYLFGKKNTNNINFLL